MRVFLSAGACAQLRAQQRATALCKKNTLWVANSQDIPMLWRQIRVNDDDCPQILSTNIVHKYCPQILSTNMFPQIFQWQIPKIYWMRVTDDDHSQIWERVRQEERSGVSQQAITEDNTRGRKQTHPEGGKGGGNKPFILCQWRP